MTFSSPTALLALLVIPLLVGLYLWSGRRRRRAAARFANPDLVPNLVPSSPGFRRHVPTILALVVPRRARHRDRPAPRRA